MVKLAKKYEAAREVADLTQEYPLEEAIGILGKMPKAKFDETVELSARLLVDPKQSNQMVRGSVQLPHGSGKTVRVLVFTDNPQEALDAGADHAGLDDMINKITEEGWLDFDVALATTSAMKSVRQVARVLGPRGLMPNPKSGTVTDDIAEGIRQVKAGRIEFKMDKGANIQMAVGKRSFEAGKLQENIQAAIDTLGRNKPESFRGRFIANVVISGTMTPGVKIDSSLYGRL
jgi:large subunit ribosomal protein L1